MYIDVILPLALTRLYTYSVPGALCDDVSVGKRVVVQFGQRKLYAGIVYRIHGQAPGKYQTKDILQVIDDSPIVTSTQLKFWEWIAEYYMCSLGEVMKAALPAALKMESDTYVARGENADIDLTENEEILLHSLDNKKSQSIKQIVARVDLPNPMSIIKSLLDKQVLTIQEEIDNLYRPKTETYLSLAPDYTTDEALNRLFDETKRAVAQQKVLLAFLSFLGSGQKPAELTISRKVLLEKAGVSAAIVAALVKRGVFTESLQVVSRVLGEAGELHDQFDLNASQAEALDRIRNGFGNHQVVLLHGVTSSGKTEIYIRLIDEVINTGKKVLYLLPEIALTAQIINRLKRVFGNRVGVYHSKFSDSQRVEVYNGVLDNSPTPGIARFDVILGVRSSVFLPLDNLGLVIVDEEHENTFKQYNPAPRYNARDAAIMLAAMHGAKVLLGTATPSVETYYNARTGKYGLVELNERYQGIELPLIKVVDIADARRRKRMKSHFSDDLLHAIEEALDRHEQVILFQNRRGFSPFIECNDCAWVPKCEYCDVSLTYHKVNNQLVCHYCGYAIQSPSQCFACGGTNLQTKGFGTEKVEEELGIFFPEATIERIDLDSTRSKSAYERIISEFEMGKIDILIGTQMVTKGLDFDRVSLVGVLNADNMLNFPDFRAYERSYQLMSQVSGRAGRRNRQGLVLIQTAQPSHPVIGQVVNHDYMGLYAHQVAERKLFKYLPFYRLINISLKHKDVKTLTGAAKGLANNLREKLGGDVLGPESPPVSRIQGLHIMSILVKVDREKPVSRVKGLIGYFIDHLRQTKGLQSLTIAIDVDPM
jgi:primosomal protein N' (replication factor Y)